MCFEVWSLRFVWCLELNRPLRFNRRCRRLALRCRALAVNCILQLIHAKFTLPAVNDSLPTCAAEHCRQPELCPLNEVSAGTSVRIKQLSASPEVSHRLREMGFGEEQQVRVVSQEASVICQVCHARLGLSQQLAETILVEPLPSARDLQLA